MYGGLTALYVSANKVGHNSNAILKNCYLRYSSQSYNTLQGRGGNYFLQNCLASDSQLNDGFNYHKSAVTNETGIIIEINCVGRNNGVDSTDNGSTCHEGYEIIRLNCAYWENGGRNLADIDTNTVSWNVGCICADSVLDVTAHTGATVILEGHIIPDLAKITVDAGGTLINNNPCTAIKNTDFPTWFQYY